MTPETIAAATGAVQNEDTRHERQVLTGRVTSAKMEKTIVVEVLRLVQHPKYRRVVRISKSFTRTMKRTRPRQETPSGSWRRDR